MTANVPDQSRRAVSSRRWALPGRHPAWPYLALVGLVLGGSLGAIWPYNPSAWTLISQTFPRGVPRTVLVDLDQSSLSDYGPLNEWSPELYRTALDQLQQAGAQAIGLDVTFSAARPDAAELDRIFTQAGAVVAAAPGDSHLSAPQQKMGVGQAPSVTYGISAVNLSALGSSYAFQTGYRDEQSAVLPTLAWQLARAAGTQVPLTTTPRFLHNFRPSVLDTRLSFRDVVAGRFRYADVQGKAVIIGQASPDPARPTGSELQARAVASLLAGPYVVFPVWAVALMVAMVTAVCTALGRFWGLVFALLSPVLTVLLWHVGVVFPGLSFAVGALIGQALVGFEYLLSSRGIQLHTTLSEQVLGSRAGLSQAVETLLSDPEAGQPCLFLVRLGGYAALEEKFGRTWAEEAVDQGLRKLDSLGAEVPGLEGFGFRWDASELVFIVDPVPTDAHARDIAAYFAYTLNSVVLRGLSLHPWGGYAWINSSPDMPASTVSAPVLIDQARRTLRPAPAQFQAEARS